MGVHALYAVHLPPEKAFCFCPPLARFAQRIYGYVDKAHISDEDVRRMDEKIRRFVR